MLDVDPIQLLLAGNTLSTAATDAAPPLAATTGVECARGFPGTCAAAHSALSDAWRLQDRALVAQLHSSAAELRRSAETYVATDQTTAEQLHSRPAAAAPSSPPSTAPLNL